MPRRHTSGFDILGMEADPTPGDPDRILRDIVPVYTELSEKATAAVDALTGSAIAEGTGQAMEGLRKKIGEEYPPKLRTAAESFGVAADAYRAYATALADAQADIDRAMDQAQPVADLAGAAPPALGATATAEQTAAAEAEQRKIDEAKSALAGARSLADQAKALRDGAASTFANELEQVGVVPERGFFDKFLDFFKNNPLIQIIVGIVVAVVSIFFPLVGLALGAVTFGLFTAFNTLADDGDFDVGAFLVGVLTLGVGGAVVLTRLSAAAANAVSNAKNAIGSFFTRLPGPIGPGIQRVSDAVRSLPPLKEFIKNFSLGFFPGAIINSIGGGVNQARDPNDPDSAFNAAVIFGGAAVGGFVGGAGAATIARLNPSADIPVPTPSRPGSPDPAGVALPPSRPGSPDPAGVALPPSRPGSPDPAGVPLPPSRPGSPDPADPAAPPSASTPGAGTGPAPATTAPGTEPPEPLPLGEKVGLATVNGIAVGSDGATKVGILLGQQQGEAGELAGDEATGAQAGLAAGVGPLLPRAR